MIVTPTSFVRSARAPTLRRIEDDAIRPVVAKQERSACSPRPTASFAAPTVHYCGGKAAIDPQVLCPRAT